MPSFPPCSCFLHGAISNPSEPLHPIQVVVARKVILPLSNATHFPDENLGCPRSINLPYSGMQELCVAIIMEVVAFAQFHGHNG